MSVCRCAGLWFVLFVTNYLLIGFCIEQSASLTISTVSTGNTKNRTVVKPTEHNKMFERQRSLHPAKTKII